MPTKRKFRVKRKEFLPSHMALLEELGGATERAKMAYHAKVQKFHKAANMIAMELGIPEKDLKKWKISEDGKSLECKEMVIKGN